MEVFKSNFFSPIIKDSITETPNNVKMSNKSSQKVLNIDFLMIFWQIIPVLNSKKKTKKNSKKRLLGPMSRSYLCENGPEIVEKKIHCCT